MAGARRAVPGCVRRRRDGLAGTYQLVGADGGRVPALVTSDICSPTHILQGNLRLGADGWYEMRFDWQNVGGAPDWTGDRGRYQHAGGDLLFSSEAWGDQFEGEIDDGVVYLYFDFCGDGRAGDLELAFVR